MEDEVDYLFEYVRDGIYRLSYKGTVIMEATFQECAEECDKRFEGGNNV